MKTMRSSSFTRWFASYCLITAAVLSCLPAAFAATWYWNQGSATWVTNTWSDSAGNTNATIGVPLATDSIVFNLAGVNNDENVSLAGNIVIAGITYTNTGFTAIYGNNTADRILTITNGLTMNVGAGQARIGNGGNRRASVTLGASQSWVNNSSSAFWHRYGTSSGWSSISLGAYTLTLAGTGTGGWTLDNPITGTGGIVKNDAGGTLTLSATNTYSGGSMVNAGVLSLLNTNAKPVAGTVAVAAGAGLGLGVGVEGTNYYGSADVDALWANTLSGVSMDPASLVGIDTTAGNFTYATAQSTRGLVKLGVNTLTLTNAQTYGGPTIINAGTLQLGDGVNDGSLASTSGITNNGTLIYNLVGSQSYGNVIAGSGALTKSGAGTLVLSGANTYGGQTTINGGGTLTLSGVRTAAAGIIHADVGTLNIQNGAFAGTVFYVGLGGDGTVNHSAGDIALSGTLQLLVGNGSNAGFTSTYNLSGGSLTGAASATRGVMLGVNSGLAGTPATNIFNLSGSGTLNMGGSILMIGRSEAANAGFTDNTFNQTGGAATVGTLTLGGNGTSSSNIVARLNLSGGAFTNSSFTKLSISSNDVSTINISGAADVTLGAFPTARGVGAAATVTFDGGILRPYAASTAYMGGLNDAFIKAGGAKFDVASGKDITISQALLADPVSTGGGLTKAGGGKLTLSGTNTFTGSTTIAEGSLTIGGAGQLGSGAYAGSITNNGALNYGSSAAQTLSGVISGIGSVTNSGSGSLVLSGNNSFTGGVTVTSGSVAASNNNGFGVGTLTLNGGTWTPNGNRTFTNPVVILANTSGNVLSSATVFSGPISGPGNWSHNGFAAGGLTFSGDNSGWTGSYRIAGANYIRLAHAKALGAGATFTFSDGATMGVLESTVDISAGADLTNNMVLGQTGKGGLTANPEFKTTANMKVSGVISDPANPTNAIGILKTGAATLTLSGMNTYSGATTVAAGTLLVNGTNSGIGAVTVATNATLGGIGIIAGAVTNTPGGTIAAGAGGLGILTVGALTLESGSTNIFEFAADGSSNDQIDASAGSLTINSGDVIKFYEVGTVGQLGGGVTGTFNLIRHNGTVNGDPSTLTVANPLAGMTYVFDTNATWLRVTIAAADNSSGWAVDASGTWTNAANWIGSVVPGVSNGVNSPAIATFSTTLTAGRTVTVDNNRNIGGITFGSSSSTYTNGYTLNGGSLRLGGGGVIQTLAGAGSHQDNVSSAITLLGDATIKNDCSGNAAGLIIGTVTGTATTGNTSTLYLDGTSTASGIGGTSRNNTISTISDGTAGGQVKVVKNGTGLWTFSLGSTFTGGFDINAGTIRSFAGGDKGFGAGLVTIGGNVTFSHANGTAVNMTNNFFLNGNVTFAGSANCSFGGQGWNLGGGVRTLAANVDTVLSAPISNGSLTKAGGQALILSGTNTYAGATTVSAGALLVNGVLDSGSGVTVNAGSLGGTGIIGGAVMVNSGGSIAPGVVGVGTLTISNNLALSSGGSFVFEITNTASMDHLMVSGNLTLPATTTVDIGTSDPTNGTYVLITAGGSISAGSFTVTGGNPLKGYVVSIDSGNVVLTVGARNIGGAALAWTGDGGLNKWDVSSSLNWLNGVTPDIFLNADNVAFSDIGGTNPVVDIITTVSPASTTVNSSTNYTFTGVGGIGGTNALTKSGTGKLTLAGANSYSGATTISGGILAVSGTDTNGAATSIGSAAGAKAMLYVPVGGSFAAATFANGNNGTGSGSIVITGGKVATTTPTTSAGIVTGNAGYGGFFMSGGSFYTRRFDCGGNNITTAGGVAVNQILGGNFTNIEHMLNRSFRTEFTVAGGNVIRNTANQVLSMGESSSSNAVLTVAGGLLDNTGQSLLLGRNTCAADLSVNLNGGILIVNNMTVGTNVLLKSSVNFNGGELKAGAASTAFLPGGLSAAYVNAGGAVVNSSSFDITIAEPLSAPVGNGVSSLTIGSAGSGYIGAPFVEITGGGGSGATAYALVDLDPASLTFGQLTNVVLSNPGVGYTGIPDVTLYGGGGIGAAVSATGTTANTSGGLTKLGTGMVTLSATNTYTGITTISNGTVQFSKQGSLYNNTPASWTAANLVVESNGCAAFALGGTGEFTTANINTLKALGTATGGFKNGSLIGLNPTTQPDLFGAAFQYSSAIANPNGGANKLGLVKLGSSELYLTGANTYTGPTRITGGGGLIVDADTRLGTPPASATPDHLILNNGGFVTGSPFTLNANRGILLEDTGGQINVITGFPFSDPNTLTYAGVIAGTGNLEIDSTGAFGAVHAGTGVLLLTGANTYSGATRITAGTLALSGSGSISNSSAIQIVSNATFKVSGLSSTFTLGGGQILANSASATGLINGNLNTAAGTVSVTYAAGTPVFNIANGTLTLTAGTVFNVNNTGAALTAGNYKVISKGTAGAVAGTLPSVTVGGGGLDAGLSASLTVISGELYLAVQTVTAITTTTTVTSSVNPSVYGQSVTFTATIVPGSGAVMPTGTVQFKTNGAAYGSPVSVSAGVPSPNGTAFVNIASLPPMGSPHTVTAEYLATGTFVSSTNSVMQTVNPAGTATNIVFSVSGSNLSLTWPGSHLGWLVQSNAVDLASPGDWHDIAGSNTGTNWNITVDAVLPNVFYRLRKP